MIREKNWKTVNAFLMPAQNGKTEETGIMVYNPVFGYFKEFNIVPIQVLFLDPDCLFEKYLKNEINLEPLKILKPDLEMEKEEVLKGLPQSVRKLRNGRV